MHTMTYNRQLSLIRRGMLLSVTQLKVQRLVFSNCQKTVVTFSICRARGCLRTPQPKALSQGRLSLLYQSSNRDWPQSQNGNSFFYHYLFLQMFHCGMFLKTARAAHKPLFNALGQLVGVSNPRGTSSGPALTESSPVYQNCVCKWSLSSSHTHNWGVELDDTLSTTQGHLDWQMEKQTKSPGHPWRSCQPSSRQNSKNR